jgi:predicted negative regulator of RcsB-dependent stress response
MKNFFLNRVFLMVAAFIVGATSVWGTTRYFENKKIQNQLTSSLLFQNNAEKILDDFFKDNIGSLGSFAQACATIQL